MQCNGTTYVGVVEDDLGEIRYVYCDACQTNAVDAWDARRRRRNWGITYLDLEVLQAPTEVRRLLHLLGALRRPFDRPRHGGLGASRPPQQDEGLRACVRRYATGPSSPG